MRWSDWHDCGTVVQRPFANEKWQGVGSECHQKPLVPLPPQSWSVTMSLDHNNLVSWLEVFKNFSLLYYQQMFLALARWKSITSTLHLPPSNYLFNNTLCWYLLLGTHSAHCRVRTPMLGLTNSLPLQWVCCSCHLLLASNCTLTTDSFHWMKKYVLYS